MMKVAFTSVLSVGLMLLLGSGSYALDSTKSEVKTDAEARQAPVSKEPQQTSASFGDWVVRCDHVAQAAASKRLCEVAQSLVVKGQQGPIAQIAFGNGLAEKPGEPMTLTVLLPVNIAFDKPPKLGAGPGAEDGPSAALTFHRCIPSGCFADVKADLNLLKDLRAAAKPGHLSFTDAAERTITLPVSFRGLAEALDELAKETAKSAAAR